MENADADALAELLREDVMLEMPPVLTWFTGRQAVARVFAVLTVTAAGIGRIVTFRDPGLFRFFGLPQKSPDG